MAGRAAGSAGPEVVRRRVVSRRVIGQRRVMPVISVIVGRRRERHERRGDDRRGGADNGARYAKRPKQRKRRTRRIILRLGGRQRQSGEPGGERSRNRYSADTHRRLPGWTADHDSRRRDKRKSLSELHRGYRTGPADGLSGCGNGLTAA